MVLITWYEYGTKIVRITWYVYGTNMVRIEHPIKTRQKVRWMWYEHGTNMVRTWYEHGTNNIDEYGTNMVQIWYELWPRTLSTYPFKHMEPPVRKGDSWVFPHQVRGRSHNHASSLWTRIFWYITIAVDLDPLEGTHEQRLRCTHALWPKLVVKCLVVRSVALYISYYTRQQLERERERKREKERIKNE